MIYIDPPYNTGHDFIYKDSFRMDEDAYAAQTDLFDEEGNRQFAENNDSNPRFHSDWCSMMYSRLLLARNLLTDDGVIFISIDDHEQENLKKICNEIFGEQNFMIQIAWRRTDNQPNIGNTAKVKEYVLCYSKNIAKAQIRRLALTNRAQKEYRYQDKKGYFRRAILLDKTRGRYHYEVKTKSGNILTGPWMKTKEEFQKLNEQNLIYWTTKGDEIPYGKIYLNTSKGQIPNDFWGIEFGTNQRASIDLEKLFGARYFDFSKPTSLIKALTLIGSFQNDIILDFFSGSATTAHAVMQLNAEDGRHRKFIMVQLPEACDPKSEAYKAGYKTICDIGKERIRRAGEKIQKEHPEIQLDTGFRVFRVDDSNMEDVYYGAGAYTQEMLAGLVSNIKPDRTELDLFFGCLLDEGFPLDKSYTTETISGCTIHCYDEGALIACFDENIPETVIRTMAEKQPLRVIFRDSSFIGSPEKINISEIFKRISPHTIVKII